MLSLCAVLFWGMIFLTPFSYDIEILNTILNYGMEIKFIALFGMGSFWAWSKDNKAFSLYLYCVLHSIYTIISSTLFPEVSGLYYAAENTMFIAYFLWIIIRPEISTAKTINRNNILLAFYKGSKGSVLMNTSQLSGMPIKSTCVIASDSCLRLKNGVDHFVLTKNVESIISSNDYVVIDTGVPVCKKFITQMKACANIPARVGVIFPRRSRCVEGIEDLLGSISPDFAVKSWFDYVPGIYFRRCINIKE